MMMVMKNLDFWQLLVSDDEKKNHCMVSTEVL